MFVPLVLGLDLDSSAQNLSAVDGSGPGL